MVAGQPGSRAKINAMANGLAGDYEYRGLMAQTWDDLRGDPTGRGDRDFYLEMIRRFGQPVLDVGCGTGRLLLDFLAEGIDIDGVDVSPEMLAICAEKANQQGLLPQLYEQPVEQLSLPQRYRTILAPSSVLQLIPDPVAVRQAMAQLYRHLLPGGVLVAPFMTLWREGMQIQREWENAHLREQDGALLYRIGRVWYDPVSGCESTEDLYQVVVDDVVIAAEHHRRSPANRSYTQEQARQLFEATGLVEVRVLSGFSMMDALPEDMLFTVIGVRGEQGDEHD
jgi:ubiquinone/menaquinone biosynthesis C-methylase UbiE